MLGIVLLGCLLIGSNLIEARPEKSSDLDKYYDVVLRLVKEAGPIVKENISRQKNISEKSSDIDLVTETDHLVEKLLIKELAARFPDHKFIGEESASQIAGSMKLTDAPTWIIDPVDGTMNFVHGLPLISISVALYVNRTAEIGIIYNPVYKQLFTARRGQGAFMNGAPIRASGEKDLRKALVMMEMGTSRDQEKMKIVMENVKIMTSLAQGIRSLGSAAWNLCMVAMGAADANFEFGVHAWDIAAGDLIIREAGGICIDPAGGPFDVLSRRVLCASSSEVTGDIVKNIQQYYPERD